METAAEKWPDSVCARRGGLTCPASCWYALSYILSICWVNSAKFGMMNFPLKALVSSMMLFPTHLQADAREVEQKYVAEYPNSWVSLMKGTQAGWLETRQRLSSAVKVRCFRGLDGTSTHLSTFEKCVPSQLSWKEIFCRAAKVTLAWGSVPPAGERGGSLHYLWDWSFPKRRLSLVPEPYLPWTLGSLSGKNNLMDPRK